MRRRTLTLAVAAGALTAAVLPASAAITPHPSRDATYAVAWAACAGAPHVQCGTLSVPLDWSRPGGQHVSVAVARRPADDSAHRVGALFFNPGGPGDGATGYVKAAENFLSAELRARFDLVGMDPRAVGGSAKVHCAVPILTPTGTLFPRTRAQFEALLRHNREVGASCLRETGPLLGHVDTVTLARDHEALRKALGEKTITWLGLSYGTQLAANYAELYPQRTRAMVLDSALEHSLPEVVQVAGEVMASEDSFNRFTRWCDTAPTCVLRGQDVGAVFDRLVAEADRHPIPVQGALRPVTGEDIRMSAVGRLRLKEPSIYGPELSWAGLSRAIAARRRGRLGVRLPPAGPQADLSPARDRLQRVRAAGPHLGADAPADPDGPAARAAPAGRVGDLAGERLHRVAASGRQPAAALDVRGVPALIVHAVHDSSDPYAWAHSLAAQIRAATC